MDKLSLEAIEERMRGVERSLGCRIDSVGTKIGNLSNLLLAARKELFIIKNKPKYHVGDSVLICNGTLKAIVSGWDVQVDHIGQHNDDPLIFVYYFIDENGQAMGYCRSEDEITVL